MKTKKTYQIIAQCDPYNAKHHYHGEKVVRRDGATPVEWVVDRCERLSLKDANRIIMGYACETAGQLIDNWGLAVIHLPKYTEGVASCGTLKDGTRFLHDDSMTYSVVPEEDGNE